MIVRSFYQVYSLESLKDFGECVIALQAGVIKKFLQGFMAPKQKRRKHQGEDYIAKAEEIDEDKKMAEEAKVLFISGLCFCLVVLLLKEELYYISYGTISRAASPHCKLRVQWVCLWGQMFPGYFEK